MFFSIYCEVHNTQEEQRRREVLHDPVREFHWLNQQHFTG